MTFYIIMAILSIAVLMGWTRHLLETKVFHEEMLYMLALFAGMAWPLGIPVVLGLWGIPRLIKAAEELSKKKKEEDARANS